MTAAARRIRRASCGCSRRHSDPQVYSAPSEGLPPAELLWVHRCAAGSGGVECRVLGGRASPLVDTSNLRLRRLDVFRLCCVPRGRRSTPSVARSGGQAHVVPCGSRRWWCARRRTDQATLDPSGRAAAHEDRDRVTFLPPHVGGLEVVAQQQAQTLAAAGHDVCVVTSRHYRDLPSSEISDAGYRIIRVPVLNC